MADKGEKYILHSENNHDYTIEIINVNDFREPSMKYAGEVYDENGKPVYNDVQFFGDDFLERCERLFPMQLSEEQAALLNQEFEFDEMCPFCGMETSSKIVPLRSVVAKCSHCGKDMIICSLCDMPHGCSGGGIECMRGIWETLLSDNGLLGEEDV